jgi:hypothetical protein
MKPIEFKYTLSEAYVANVFYERGAKISRDQYVKIELKTPGARSLLLSTLGPPNLWTSVPLSGNWDQIHYDRPIVSEDDLVEALCGLAKLPVRARADWEPGVPYPATIIHPPQDMVVSKPKLGLGNNLYRSYIRILMSIRYKTYVGVRR